MVIKKQQLKIHREGLYTRQQIFFNFIYFFWKSYGTRCNSDVYQQGKKCCLRPFQTIQNDKKFLPPNCGGQHLRSIFWLLSLGKLTYDFEKLHRTLLLSITLSKLTQHQFYITALLLLYGQFFSHQKIFRQAQALAPAQVIVQLPRQSMTQKS